MSNTVNQFGGRCPHTSFFKGGQMSRGGGGGDALPLHITITPSLLANDIKVA